MSLQPFLNTLDRFEQQLKSYEADKLLWLLEPECAQYQCPHDEDELDELILEVQESIALLHKDIKRFERLMPDTDMTEGRRDPIQEPFRHRVVHEPSFVA